MDKMSFREAQLAVLGSMPKNCAWKSIELNNEQRFYIGDNLEVTEISLEAQIVNVQMCEGPNSYVHIDNLADWVVDECVEILRGVAAYHDWDNHKNEMWRIESNNNPRAPKPEKK